MPTGLIPWLLGKDVAITITPQDVAPDGELSDNAIGALAFQGRIDGAETDAQLVTENITPINSFYSNPVPIEMGAQYTITEILAALPLVEALNKGFGYSNVLMAAAAESYYHKLVITDNQNDGTDIRVQTIYVLMQTPERRTIAKGKNTNVAVFQTIAVYDTGTGNSVANPANS